MNRLIIHLLVLGILLLTASGLGFWLSAHILDSAKAHKENYVEWRDKWDQREDDCLNDPSCNMYRFERKRDLDDVPSAGIAELFVSCMVIALSLFFLIGGLLLGAVSFDSRKDYEPPNQSVKLLSRKVS